MLRKEVEPGEALGKHATLERMPVDPRRDANLPMVPNGMRKIDAANVAAPIILARSGREGLSDGALLAIEKYRLLCTRVLQVARSLKAQVFLVTSAVAKDGKTVTAVNLAYGLSRVQGKRTLLLELDLRRPTMKDLLNVKTQRPEASFLELDNDWHESLWELRPNLHALVAMNSSLRSDVLLQSERMLTVLAEARQQYDYIVMDSAPLLSAADTLALLPLVDQALFVVRAGQTRIDRAQEAIGLMGSKLLGCVLNDVQEMQYTEYYDKDYLRGGAR